MTYVLLCWFIIVRFIGHCCYITGIHSRRLVLEIFSMVVAIIICDIIYHSNRKYRRSHCQFLYRSLIDWPFQVEKLLWWRLLTKTLLIIESKPIRRSFFYPIHLHRIRKSPYSLVYYFYVIVQYHYIIGVICWIINNNETTRKAMMQNNLLVK